MLASSLNVATIIDTVVFCNPRSFAFGTGRGCLLAVDSRWAVVISPICRRQKDLQILGIIISHFSEELFSIYHLIRSPSSSKLMFRWRVLGPV